MNTFLNVLWFIFSGVWLALAYALAGVVFFVLIVTIPFGIAAFRLAGYALWPFGRMVVHDSRAGGWSVLGNIVWCLLAGLWLAIIHVVCGIALCITIIGIPLGVANFKMVPLALTPLGVRVVDEPRHYPVYR